ncbi:MAG: hypothetical protein ACI8WT_004853, partial [Clostridium sp.]
QVKTRFRLTYTQISFFSTKVDLSQDLDRRLD